MKEFISNLVLNNILTTLLGAGLGGLITHSFYKSKLKKEQKIRFENAVGDKIASSLIEVRELITKANVIEVYDIDKVIEESNGKYDVDIYDNPIYPGILEDEKIFIDFHTEIMNARFKYGNYLPRDVATYLLYGERYFTKLMSFISSFNDTHLHTFGTIFIKDIQDWQRSLDTVIVKKLNEAPTKLESHDGQKWERCKKKTDEKLWNPSILRKLIDEEKSELTNMAWEIIDGINED